MARTYRPGDWRRDIRVAKWEIEYIGIFNLKSLYQMMYDFFKEEGWENPSGGEPEEFYFQREVPNVGKEMRYWWRFQLIPNVNTVTKYNYTRYLMKLDVRCLMMKKVDIVVDGKKHKTWKGSITMFCEAWLQLDYQNRWQNHRILKHFDKFFRERIYKPYWEAHRLELYKKCYDVNREVKKFLKLKSPYPEDKPWRGGKGTPY